MHGAARHRLLRGSEHGNRPDWRCDITKCRSASFWAPWRFCLSFSETGSCTGIGGRCEPADEPACAPRRPAPFRSHGGFRLEPVPDAPAPEKSCLRRGLAELRSSGCRGPAGTRLSLGHPAIEAAKTRTRCPAPVGTEKSKGL